MERLATCAIVLALAAGSIALAAEAWAQSDPSPTPATPRLAEAAPPTRLGPGHAQRVSPLWTPDGAAVVSRGWGGVGLYITDLDGTHDRPLDPSYRGPLGWTPDGAVLCLARPDGDRALPWRGDDRDEAAPCELPRVQPGLGVAQFDDGQVAIFAHLFEGTLTVVDAAGPRTLLAGDALSQVSVSPDGRQVAVCRGPLSDPRLTLLALTGESVELGRGAQPAWSPDGRYVVFAVPSGQVVVDGGAGFAQSDLWVWDTATGSPRPLTQTADRVELEPSFSPDGSALVFADWQSGAIFVSAFAQEATP